MSKSTAELSITKRSILSYIQFKTHNGYSFFASNEKISKGLGLTVGTTKTYINALIREGFLIKSMDGKKRVLSLSGKTFIPIYEDCTNIDKKMLKEDRDEMKRDNTYLQRELKGAEMRCSQLQEERLNLVLNETEFNKKIDELKNELEKEKELNQSLSKRIEDIENLFYKNGITQEQLNKAIKENKAA